MHVLVSPIYLSRLSSLATLEHPEALILENHIYVVALAPEFIESVSTAKWIPLLQLHHLSLLLSNIQNRVVPELQDLAPTWEIVLISLFAAGACKLIRIRSPRGLV